MLAGEAVGAAILCPSCISIRIHPDVTNLEDILSLDGLAEAAKDELHAIWAKGLRVQFDEYSVVIWLFSDLH